MPNKNCSVGLPPDQAEVLEQIARACSCSRSVLCRRLIYVALKGFLAEFENMAWSKRNESAQFSPEELAAAESFGKKVQALYRAAVEDRLEAMTQAQVDKMLEEAAKTQVR